MNGSATFSGIESVPGTRSKANGSTASGYPTTTTFA